MAAPAAAASGALVSVKGTVVPRGAELVVGVRTPEEAEEERARLAIFLKEDEDFFIVSWPGPFAAAAAAGRPRPAPPLTARPPCYPARPPPGPPLRSCAPSPPSCGRASSPAWTCPGKPQSTPPPPVKAAPQALLPPDGMSSCRCATPCPCRTTERFPKGISRRREQVRRAVEVGTRHWTPELHGRLQAMREWLAWCGGQLRWCKATAPSGQLTTCQGC